MMRIAGRNSDGLAKPIKTDRDGRIVLGGEEKVLLSQPTSTDGYEVPNGSSIETHYLDVDGIDKIKIVTAMGSSAEYRMEVREFRVVAGGSVTHIKTHFLSDEAMTGNKVLEANLTGRANQIKVHVFNGKPTPFMVGLSVFGTKSKRLEYYNETTRTFESQKEIATTEKVDEVIQTFGTREILNQPVSSDGFQVLANSSNETIYLDVVGVDRLTIGTALSNIEIPYKMEVIEYQLVVGGQVSHVKTHSLTDDTVTGTNILEVKLTGKANRVKIKVFNDTDTSFWIGLTVYGKHSNSLEYYNEDLRSFESQKEIATEKSLKDIANILTRGLTSTENPTKVPMVRNVVITKDVPVKQIVGSGNGVFYGAGNTLGELYTSADGKTWELFHTFPISSGVTMLLVGDTGRLVAGFFDGSVFISDEQGEFNSTPSFTTGAISHNFGRFKHGNVLGFNTYETAGFDNGQKHEAFVSTDNGASFKKVFDNDTFDTLPPTSEQRIHLHDIEYDMQSGRLYLWSGDFEARTLNYSDDWGKTWKMAFPRGEAGNATAIIAVPDGIVFGADTEGGGIGFLPLDRSKNIKPDLDINNYINDYWKFNNDGGRFIACRKFVDREKGIYLIPYIVEYDDDKVRNAYLAYSSNGTDWKILWESSHTGHATGLESVDYIDGTLVGTYSIERDYHIFTANVEL